MRKVVRRKATVPPLPSILLEGDHPSAPPVRVGEKKFALGPSAPVQHFGQPTADLPPSYGTKRLFLTARDPHCLYAHWDIPHEQQIRYNKASADQHLVLRVHPAGQKAAKISEVHVHPESTHWFVHVEKAGAPYVAELGYYREVHGRRSWTRVIESTPAATPPDCASADKTARFATIPVEFPFEKLAATTRQFVRKPLPLALALRELREAAEGLPPSLGLTPEQEAAIAVALGADAALPGQTGSLEIAELLRGESEHEFPSFVTPEFGLPSDVGGISSPEGGMPEGEKNFWLNINAELVIYGATDPDATLSVAGKAVALRPDGSFRLRFALPDGFYELPVTAISADRTEGRAVELKFARATKTQGDVGVQPQDPSLGPPMPENV